MIGILILVLLIPLVVVGALVHEREATRNTVEMEVAEKWGGSQSLLGPMRDSCLRASSSKARYVLRSAIAASTRSRSTKWV
jgi:inner membrane protein involved in colicin E2 resistance